MRLYHAANVYETTNQDEKERNVRAQMTWRELYRAHAGVFWPAHSYKYVRSGRDIGDKRDVPFVRDVIQVALDKCLDPLDLIVLTNADTSICKEGIEDIVCRLFHTQGCWSNRREMDRPHKIWLDQQQILDRGADSKGVDLFAFRASWWRENRDSFPDLLIGYEGWDWVLQFMIGLEGKLDREIVYHESHGFPYWYNHRKIAFGNLHNRKLCWEWANKRPDFTLIKANWPGLGLYGLDSGRKK